MNNPTHAWCDNCHAIQEVRIEIMENVDTTGSYLGGDIVCKVCAWIVATVYRIKQESYIMNRPITSHKQMLEEGEAWGEYHAGTAPKPIEVRNG